MRLFGVFLSTISIVTRMDPRRGVFTGNRFLGRISSFQGLEGTLHRSFVQLWFFGVDTFVGRFATLELWGSKGHFSGH